MYTPSHLIPAKLTTPDTQSFRLRSAGVRSSRTQSAADNSSGADAPAIDHSSRPPCTCGRSGQAQLAVSTFTNTLSVEKKYPQPKLYVGRILTQHGVMEKLTPEQQKEVDAHNAKFEKRHLRIRAYNSVIREHDETGTVSEEAG
jgi:hypothetical protein